jgi:hypothetical protein
VGFKEGNLVGINLEGDIVGDAIETLNDVGVLVGILVNMLNIDIVGTRLGNALGVTGTGAVENAAQPTPL